MLCPALLWNLRYRKRQSEECSKHRRWVMKTIAIILGIVVSLITIVGFLQGEPTLVLQLPVKLIVLIDLTIELVRTCLEECF